MPILSAIIPTHNRSRYALNAITTILENFPDTEVVVSDTSDTRGLESALSHWIREGRLIYSHTSELLDIVRNFEHGLNLATGDYLIFLGDDDCLGPQAEQIAHWAASKGIDTINSSQGTSYCWPDFRSKYFKDGYAAKLAIAPYEATIFEIDAIAELRACVDNFGAGPAKMPRAYHGMIRRDLTKKIQEKHGSFFGGVSPDIYSSVLLSVEGAKFVQLDFPFILPGSSGVSAAGQAASGGHKGKLRDNAHIGAFNNLVWDKSIPEFYCVQTVWSFSMLKAVEKIPSLRLEPNYPRLYVRCLLYHRKYFKETIDSICYRASKTGSFYMLTNIIAALIKELLFQMKRISQRTFKPKATSNSVVIENLPTIGDAYLALANYTKQSVKQLDI